jgi:hypothetical protein
LKVTVAGAADPTFNGTGYVLARPSSTQFTLAGVGADASAGSGGTATALNIGGAITGGAFVEGTLLPADWRGNFLFADLNSSNLVRVALDGANVPARVDLAAQVAGGAVGITSGPDGAIYLLTFGSRLYRYGPSAAQPAAIVVDRSPVRVEERSSAALSVSLSAAPAAAVTVSASVSGPPELTVASGAALTFTPSNWRLPQAVVVAAAGDPDVDDAAATLTLAGSGLAAVDVPIVVRDVDTQALVLSAASLSIDEGGAAGIFTVRLARPTAGDIPVTVARTSGSSGVSVTAGSSLTFTPADWDVPKQVAVAAVADADSADSSAVLTISTPSAPPRTVAVSAADTDPRPPAITSQPRTTAVVGAPYRYGVVATGIPRPVLSLASGPAGMAIDAAGTITWTPVSPGSAAVSVVAANGLLPDAVQSFSISVAPDSAPTAILTRPADGEIVSGSGAEFFGDGRDDVGTVAAGFYVDGVLGYTDSNSEGHYHFNGRHFAWDTTAYADGQHTVRFLVRDTAGQTGFAEARVTVANSPAAPARHGCGCGSARAAAPWWLAVAMLALRRQRSGDSSRCANRSAGSS